MQAIQLRELSPTEIDTVSGALTWAQRLALSVVTPGGLVTVLLAEGLANSYQAGWDGAHGRANMND